jgi:predicted house-cleaning NTP pyrophosphatase (Maf/HAM1 superfamily)
VDENINQNQPQQNEAQTLEKEKLAKVAKLYDFMAELFTADTVNSSQPINQPNNSENDKNIFSDFVLEDHKLITSEKNQSSNDNTESKSNNIEPEKQSSQTWTRKNIDVYVKFVESFVLKNKGFIHKDYLREAFGKKFENNLSDFDKLQVSPKSSILIWQKKLHDNIYNRLILKNIIVFDDPYYIHVDYIKKWYKAINNPVNSAGSEKKAEM